MKQELSEAKREIFRLQQGGNNPTATRPNPHRTPRGHPRSLGLAHTGAERKMLELLSHRFPRGRPAPPSEWC